MFVGIDVGARWLHCVGLDPRLRVLKIGVFPSSEPAGLLRWARAADVIAIDAPAALSTAPHRDDTTNSSKFRLARCAEIALGRQERAWVPWPTPTDAPVPWMRVGLDLFASFALLENSPIEVFPNAGFRALAKGARVSSKRTVEGARTRAELLKRAGVDEPSLVRWSHDGLDAALAALIALRKARGTARPVTCGHDGSAIWLP